MASDFLYFLARARNKMRRAWTWNRKRDEWMNRYHEIIRHLMMLMMTENERSDARRCRVQTTSRRRHSIQCTGAREWENAFRQRRTDAKPAYWESSDWHIAHMTETCLQSIKSDNRNKSRTKATRMRPTMTKAMPHAHTHTHHTHTYWIRNEKNTA